MEAMSTGQVETRNSERRRRALVNSCACIRLESAISTAIAAEPAAGDRFMRQAPGELNDALMVGVRGEVLKETCHIIRARFSNRETSGSPCGKSRPNENAELVVSMRFLANMGMARPCAASSDPRFSVGRDAANMQVYFCV